MVRSLALVVLALLVTACGASVSAVEVGSPAPPLRLPDTRGQTVDLAQFQGRVVLLNFWALWCEPCKAEMPDFQAALDRYGPQGFEVVTVDVGDPPARVAAYLDAHRYTFVSLVDERLKATRAYDTRALPLSLVLDREGIVRARRISPFEPGQLVAQIEGVLGQAVRPPATSTPAPVQSTRTATPAPTSSPGATPSPKATATATRTARPSPSSTAARTPTAIPSPTTTVRPPRPTRTPTPLPASATPTATTRPADTAVPSPTSTSTPTPTPTPTNTSEPPLYAVTLTGETYRSVFPGDTATFAAELTNTGTTSDWIDVGLLAGPPQGWGAKFCVGATCYDYTHPPVPVPLESGGLQALFVKLIASDGAPAGQVVTARLWVRSQGDPEAEASLDVAAEVILP